MGFVTPFIPIIAAALSTAGTVYAANKSASAPAPAPAPAPKLIPAVAPPPPKPTVKPVIAPPPPKKAVTVGDPPALTPAQKVNSIYTGPQGILDPANTGRATLLGG